MRSSSSPENRARWLELSPEMRQSIARLQPDHLLEPRHLLKIKDPDAPVISGVIGTVINCATHADERDPELPNFNSSVNYEGYRFAIIRHIQVVSMDITQQLGIDPGFDIAVRVFKRPILIDEEDYSRALRVVIERTNRLLAVGDVPPIPPFQGKLFDPNSIPGMQDVNLD